MEDIHHVLGTKPHIQSTITELQLHKIFIQYLFLRIEDSWIVKLAGYFDTDNFWTGKYAGDPHTDNS